MFMYSFTFPAEAAGLGVTIHDADGTEVATGTLGSTPNSSGVIVHNAELESGNYVGTVELATAGITNLNPASWRILPDRVESTGLTSAAGVAANETAFFVATGPTVDTAGNGGVFADFIADSRHGPLPDWASVVDGDIVLTEDAGTCAYSFVGLYDYDFSDTTPPDADGTIGSQFTIHFDAANANATGATAGSGLDAQTATAARAGGLAAASSVTVELLAYADQDAANIPDGVATPSVAFTLTRVAQAAVLPA